MDNVIKEIPSFDDIIEYETNHGYGRDIREAAYSYVMEMHDIEIDPDQAFTDYHDLKNKEKLSKKEQLIVDGMRGFEDLYLDIASHITKIANGAPIWREICVKNLKRFEEDLFKHGKTISDNEPDDSGLQGVGLSWSWESEGAISYNNVTGDKCVRIAAQSNKDDIDIPATIAINLITRKEETEIRMRKNRPLKLLQLCNSNKSNDINEKLCKNQKEFAKKRNISKGIIFDDVKIIT